GLKPLASASIARTWASGHARARKARADCTRSRCSSSRVRSIRSARPRQPEATLGDDVLLDLDRPGGDGGGDVAHPLSPDEAGERRLRGVVRELAREAEQLEPDVAHLLLETRRVQARDRSLDGRHLAARLERDDAVAEQARRLVAGAQAGELLAHV